jgi:hypothetical protein
MKPFKQLLLLVAIGLPLTIQSQAQDRRLPVIDMHLHSITEIWAEKRLCFPQPCESLPSKISDPKQLRPAALAEMDKYNVVLAVVSGERDDVLQWTSSDEDKFLTVLQSGVQMTFRIQT